MKKFNRLQEGVGFAVLMTITYIVIELYHTENITTKLVLKSVVTSIIAGSVAGFLYAWVMGLWFKHQDRKKDSRDIN